MTIIKLRELRKHNKISQSTISVLCGYSQKKISRFEKIKNINNISELENIKKAYYKAFKSLGLNYKQDLELNLFINYFESMQLKEKKNVYRTTEKKKKI